jgi:hypothetical protein
MTERVRSQLCRLWELLLPGLIALYPLAGPVDAAAPGTFRTTSEVWRAEVAPSAKSSTRVQRLPRGEQVPAGRGAASAVK